MLIMVGVLLFYFSWMVLILVTQLVTPMWKKHQLMIGQVMTLAQAQVIWLSFAELIMVLELM
jgi:hypothetical protein